MKIAITSSDDNLSAKLDARFARSNYWYIYDSDTSEGYFFDNTDNAETEHGAGIKAATKLIELTVTSLITGDVGPKASDVLKNKVAVYKGDKNKSIEENLHLFLENKLNKLNV
jgi:predicted Fe-Mo cluster-binding NifX family protein